MNTGYKERRESGIPWLGALPAHWKPAKLKYISDIVNGATPDSGNDSYWDGDIVWITPSDLGKLSSAYVSDSKRRISEAGFKSCGTSMVPADTVIMTTRAPIGNSCITTVEACFNQGCKALVLRDGDNKFVYYQLVGYRPYLEMLGSGSTFMELSTDKFKDFVLPVPPLPEQRAIAAYLDHKTTQLDTLLAQKEALLQMLHQKRQALINEAVTQGLDPDAPRKPSGVAWLGDVPAHWMLKSFRYEISFLTDFTANGSFADLAKNVDYQTEGYSRLVRLTDLRHNLNKDGLYVSEKAHNYLAKSELFGGELLLANVGAYSGLAWLMPFIEGKATLAPNMFLLRFKATLNNDFAYFALIADYLHSQLKEKAISSAQPKLNKENVRSTLILVPPIEEQCLIVDLIKTRTAKINEATAAIHTQIKTLKAYRQSLISEVVTGKVDVRTAEAVAPEADLPLWRQ